MILVPRKRRAGKIWHSENRPLGPPARATSAVGCALTGAWGLNGSPVAVGKETVAVSSYRWELGGRTTGTY